MNSKTNHTARRHLAVIASALSVTISTGAYAQGLTKTTGFLTSLQSILTTWLPIVAVIAGILIVIGYLLHFVQKDVFVRWIIGLIVGGGVSEIVGLFIT